LDRLRREKGLPFVRFSSRAEPIFFRTCCSGLGKTVSFPRKTVICNRGKGVEQTNGRLRKTHTLWGLILRGQDPTGVSLEGFLQKFNRKEDEDNGKK